MVGIAAKIVSNAVVCRQCGKHRSNTDRCMTGAIGELRPGPSFWLGIHIKATPFESQHQFTRNSPFLHANTLHTSNAIIVRNSSVFSCPPVCIWWLFSVHSFFCAFFFFFYFPPCHGLHVSIDRSHWRVETRCLCIFALFLVGINIAIAWPLHHISTTSDM